MTELNRGQHPVVLFYFLNFIIHLFYFISFWAAEGLLYARAAPAVVCGLLIVVGSLVLEHWL